MADDTRLITRATMTLRGRRTLSQADAIIRLAESSMSGS